jgi:hypothetical protein
MRKQPWVRFLLAEPVLTMNNEAFVYFMLKLIL